MFRMSTTRLDYSLYLPGTAQADRCSCPYSVGKSRSVTPARPTAGRAPGSRRDRFRAGVFGGGCGREIVFEPLSDGRSRAMQQYALIRGGDLQDRADLFGGVAFDIAQREHDQLSFGQFREGR